MGEPASEINLVVDLSSFRLISNGSFGPLLFFVVSFGRTSLAFRSRDLLGMPPTKNCARCFS